MGSIMFWLTIAIAALVIDIVSTTFLFIWFTIGGLAAIIVKMLGFSFGIQLITFLAVSITTLAVGYPLARKHIKSNIPKLATQEEGYIGREMTVEAEVIEKGTIKVDGIYWTVKNIGKPVKKGDRIEIIGIEGNKLVIRKVGEN